MKKTSINTAAPTVIKNKTSKFTLLARPEIAPKGLQPGVIKEVYNVTGTEKGEEFSRMEIVFQLDVLDSAGKNFTLTKTYNIGENGRGISLFLNDYNSMMNTELTKTDLYDFDPASLTDKRAVAEVEYIDGPKGVSSTIKAFQPPQPVAA